MMPATVLAVQALQKQYAQHVAVRDVTFHVGHGEVYGLLGPNGAGKSTTIKMLSCLIRPNKGSIVIGGIDAIRRTREVKRLIGIVPQDIALYDDFSARENLLFFGRLYGMHGLPLRRRVDHLLERVGLLERAGDRVGGFSGGMKRRINIAAGLVHSPKLLYLDEPTVGIDPQSRRRILDLVKDLNRDGLSVIYTTHYMEEAEELCHRIGVIDHGSIIAEGTLGELKDSTSESVPIHITLRDPILNGARTTLEQELRPVGQKISFSSDQERFTLLTNDPKTALPFTLTRLANLDLDVAHLEIEEPGLESVFLKLTGRSLRD